MVPALSVGDEERLTTKMIRARDRGWRHFVVTIERAGPAGARQRAQWLLVSFKPHVTDAVWTVGDASRLDVAW